MHNYSAAEIAGLLNVHRQTVGKWIKEGCPTVKHGGRHSGKAHELNLGEVVDWLQRKAIKDTVGDTNNISDVEEAKRRKVTAEAGLAELELAKQRGDVVLIADVEKTVSRTLSDVRQRLLALTAKMPLIRSTASDAEAKELGLEFLIECLDGLTRYGSEGAGDITGENDSESDSDNPEAAAEADDQPVG